MLQPIRAFWRPTRLTLGTHGGRIEVEGNQMATKITALDLAMQFRERAEQRGGSLWLSVKQVAFFRSLATPVYRGSENVRADVVSQTVHGRPQIFSYFPDGTVWVCSVSHNGAGCFAPEVGSR